MSSIVPPAASTAAFRFSHTWRICASMSPTPAIVPSARREVIPEINTSLPFASIAIAWEKCPDGWRILSLWICRLAINGDCHLFKKCQGFIGREYVTELLDHVLERGAVLI